MKRFFRLCIGVITGIFVGSIFQIRVYSASPPVVAYYFNYWGSPFGGKITRSFESWTFPLKNGQATNPTIIQGPEPWRRQITTGDANTYPLLGPYDSSSPDVVRWQAQTARNAGINAFAIFFFGNEFNKTTKETDDTPERSRMWWTATHVTIPIIEESAQQPFSFLIGQDDFGFNDSDPSYSSTCDYAQRSCAGLTLSDLPQPVVTYLVANQLTQKKYADIVLNAYSALSKWKDSPAYFKVNGKPAYFFGPLEPYRDNPAKVDLCFRGIETLLHLPSHGIYFIAYDGVVTWGTDDAAINIWKNIVDGFDDGWGISKGIVYQDDANFTNTRASIASTAKRITQAGFDWIPNIQTSFDDTSIRNRPDNDILNAATHSWLKRNNGDTFKKSIIVNRDTQYPKKMYFLSSWNATPLEGYSVEPAATWGNDASTDPYKYVKILATNLTEANFSPASLPPYAAVDPLRATALNISQNTPSLPSDITHDGKVDIADLRILLSSFGQKGSSHFIPADINGDGNVDVFDFTILVSQFGKTQ